VLQQGRDNHPPESPPLAAYAASNTRRGAAAHYIRSECERFCCETLKAVFLGERKLALQDAHVMDAQNNFNGNIESKANGGGHLLDNDVTVLSTSQDPIDDWRGPHGLVDSFVEVWDYVGGARFRGFVAERQDKRAMFVFLDRDSFGNELKSG
jgi:Ornithine decarboxylase antizyme